MLRKRSAMQVPLVIFAWEDRFMWGDVRNAHGLAVSDEFLVRSALWSRVALVVQRGEKATDRWSQLEGKARAYLDFCLSLPPDTVVVLMDSSDTAVLASPELLLERFRWGRDGLRRQQEMEEAKGSVRTAGPQH